MNYKRYFLVLLVALSALLTACSFVGTSKEDMEKMPVTTPGYEEYSVDRFKELRGSEKFLLFFHADWCPSCRILEKKIKSDLSVLNGHTVLEANYDRESALKKEYDVVNQSTLIFFNKDGSVAEKRVNPRLSLIEKFFQ